MNRLRIAAASAAAGIILLYAAAFAHVNATQPDASGQHQVWVCKYVGQPGDFETLKPGKNPIIVDVASADAFVGADFADGQTHSFVIDLATEANTGQGERYTGEATCPTNATASPSSEPTVTPTDEPTPEPTMSPSDPPTATLPPFSSPDPLPTTEPSVEPSLAPSAEPSLAPNPTLPPTDMTDPSYVNRDPSPIGFGSLVFGFIVGALTFSGAAATRRNRRVH